MIAIKADNLTKSFKLNRVVNMISLEVESGEIYGFLGRNGAGKSTFINMLTGILIPSSGSFELLESSPTKRIGVLPDYSTFYDHMSAYDHLKYFSGVSGYKVTKEAIIETLNMVGLESEIHKKVSKFSFGMKKKLGIAQALVNDPDLIFLDEPTSGVDAESAIQIKKLIKNLNKQGKTIFMTSHNLNEVEEICTRVAIMKNGNIHLEGTISELKSSFQNVVTAKIRIQDKVQDGARKDIVNFLKKNFPDFSWENNYLRVEVGHENNIPVILRMLLQLHVNVFTVDIIEPSLEEIFLEQNQAI